MSYRQINEIYYDEIGSLEDPCRYCGIPATGWDHIPPIHSADRMPEEERACHKFKKVPCCKECNSFLGGIMLLTISERRQYVKEKLAKKYRHHASMTNWDDDELVQLGPNLSQNIRSHLKFARYIKQRLGYTADLDPPLVRWTEPVKLKSPPIVPQLPVVDEIKPAVHQKWEQISFEF